MHIDYTISSVSSEEDLASIIAFAQSIFGDDENPCLQYDFWLPHYRMAPDLLLYAADGGRALGCVFGRIDGENITIGPVAASPDHRRCGIGRALMMEMEVRARHRHITTLVLGARQEAEPFYLSCGYTPFLFIQSDKASLAELQASNRVYPEAWSHEADGWARLMLATQNIDGDLQEQYDGRFPGCVTQTVFVKRLKNG